MATSNSLKERLAAGIVLVAEGYFFLKHCWA